MVECLNVENIDILLPFYRDLLGFKVSDFGLKPYGLHFFHVNGRHHSFAMVGSGRKSMHHFMIELGSLDDVGQAYDLAQIEEARIAYTLGRHTNDHVRSIYVNTPSGLNMAGADALLIRRPGNRMRPLKGRHCGDMSASICRMSNESGYARCASQRRRGGRVPDPSVAPLNCAWVDAVVARE